MVGAYTIILIGQPPWPVVVIATIAVAIVFALGDGAGGVPAPPQCESIDPVDRVVRRQLRVAEPGDPDRGVRAEGDERLDLALRVRADRLRVDPEAGRRDDRRDPGAAGRPRALPPADADGRPDARGGGGLPDGAHPRRQGEHGHRDGVRDERSAGRGRRVPASSRRRARSRPTSGSTRCCTRSSRRSSAAWAVCAGLCWGATCSARSSSALQAYLPLELRSYRDAFAFAAVIVMLLVRPRASSSPASTATRV